MEIALTMAFWFRKTYGLPPNDPRFLSLTQNEIEIEYWAHRYHDNPNQQVFDDPDFDEEAIINEFSDEDFEDIPLDPPAP